MYDRTRDNCHEQTQRNAMLEPGKSSGTRDVVCLHFLFRSFQI